MLKITIIGNGNVGTKLADKINKLKDFNLLEWYGRDWQDKKIPKKYKSYIKNYSKFKHADF